MPRRTFKNKRTKKISSLNTALLQAPTPEAINKVRYVFGQKCE